MEPSADIQHGTTESAKPGRSKTARVLNVRLLLGTVLAAAVVVPAAYGWHWHQVRVTASAFLERAAEHEAAGEWLEAARNLHRYLQLHPSDPKAAARLAEVFDRSAADPNGKARACDLYYVAIGLAAEEDRPKLRHRVAELQLELARFDGRRLTSAERETRDLLAADPQDPQANRLLALVLDAQLQAIAAIRPGVSCCEVDAVARGVIERAGFGSRFGHALGHGIGLQVHESPRLAAGSEAVLRTGMVVTVEPGVYLPGVGGIRIEDDVLVTRSGSEVLTSVPKQWEDTQLAG